MLLDVTRLVTLLAVCHVTAAGPPYPPGGCGTPGVPGNGSVIYPSKAPRTGEGRAPPRYGVGDRVKYVCQGGHRVRGGEWRTCEAGGGWGGEPPYCALDLAAQRPAQQSGTLLSYAPGLATDGTPDTCSFTPQTPAPRWWQVSLGDTHNVTRVSVTISKGSLQHFTVYVIELLEDNKALYKPCASYQGVFPSATLELPCSGDGQRGSFVYIRDDRAEEEYLGLCEVQVFGAGDSACGLPDIPRHAKLKVENRTAIFSCEEGYRLRGGHSLTCNHRGRWTGVPSRCEEIQCPVPSTPEHGGVTLSPPSSSNSSASLLPPLGAPRMGWQAEYRCDPGHAPPDPPTRVCEATGEWSGASPLCEKLHCGPPPTVAHSYSSLINSSGIELAVYTCRHGTAIKGALITAVSTCEPSGVWKPPNITCQSPENTTSIPIKRNPLLKPVDRRPSGRALRPTFDSDAEVLFELSGTKNSQISSVPRVPSESMNPVSDNREVKLVTALVVVATLLLASVFVLFLVLAFYKKKRITRSQLTSGAPGSSNDFDSDKWSPRSSKDISAVMSFANKGFTSSIDTINRQLPSPDSSNRSSLQITNSMNSGTLTLHLDRKQSSTEININRAMNVKKELKNRSSNDIREPPYETILKLGAGISTGNPEENYIDEDEYLNQQLYNEIFEPENACGTSSQKSEHSYETLKEGARVKREPSYQSVSEFTKLKTENGYESLSEKGDNGYERIKEKDHQYEALRERKDDGYETVGENIESNSVLNPVQNNIETNEEIDSLNSSDNEEFHKSDTDRQDKSVKSDTVPDILQGIGSERESESEETIQVPPEILAMYAKIDRSKKKRKLKTPAGELQLIIKHVGEEQDLDGYEQLPVILMKSKDLDKKPTPPPRPKNMVPFGALVDSSKESVIEPEVCSDNDNCSSVGSYKTAPSSNFSTISTRSGDFFDISSSRPLPPIPRT